MKNYKIKINVNCDMNDKTFIQKLENEIIK